MSSRILRGVGPPDPPRRQQFGRICGVIPGKRGAEKEVAEGTEKIAYGNISRNFGRARPDFIISHLSANVNTFYKKNCTNFHFHFCAICIMEISDNSLCRTKALNRESQKKLGEFSSPNFFYFFGSLFWIKSNLKFFPL